MLDLLYVVLIVSISVIPQIVVTRIYEKYSEIKPGYNISGEQIVKEMLDHYGISGVSINRVLGKLTDHYDSKEKAIYLSELNFNRTSIAGIAVAAHEAGHAIQDNRDYLFLKLRMFIGRGAIVASKFSWILIYVGFILYFTPFIWLGIILLGVVLLFDFITLPVEINASRRAKRYLLSTGMYSEEEIRGFCKVLTAAAFTYVAATFAGTLQLARLLKGVSRD